MRYFLGESPFLFYRKSGIVFNCSFSNLKSYICFYTNTPTDAVIGLFTGNGKNYDSSDFYNDKDVFVQITNLYYQLDRDITNVRNDYSSLQSNYNDLKNKNDSLNSEINSVKSNYSSLQSNYNSLKYQNDSLNSEISNLKSQNSYNVNKINNLITSNENLNQELKKEKQIREEKEKNLQRLKDAFEKSKYLIENKNVEESKKFIEKFIINKFLKEFEIEKEKKSEFKISLISHMKTFTEEFMDYSKTFLQSFKTNSQNIIKEYNIKENNIIEHINFIVIGKAGVGKSAFINESLLLSGNKKAKEGDGISVTKESVLYNSEKLKMVRMWDTQGLDYKITQELILQEVKRIVEDGLKKGPDHYINIILYCTSGNRFQDEDGQLIYEIMKLYPSDNLPVIITQLQAYFKSQSKKMEETIRKVLDNYLDHQIVQKIEIRSIVSRDFIDEDTNTVYKANGIPELLRLSFDIMGRSISSATCKKLSQDIEDLCRDYVDKKIDFIHNIFKYEMEILEVAKSSFVEDMEEEDYFSNQKKKQKKELSELNMYRKIENKNYFVENFIKIMKNKFIYIYNNLNNKNIPIDDKFINKEKQNNNKIDNKNNNKKNENSQIENNNKKEENKKKNDNKKENNQKEERQNLEEEKKIKDDKPLVLFFIEDRLQNLNKRINEASDKTFEKIFQKLYQNYLTDLQKEQSIKNKEFGDNSQIIDVVEIEKKFKEKLFPYFKNEFFKTFFCIILKLFMNNLKDILILNYQKELKENEIVQKIINQKAEDSLKSITEKLKKNLILDLDNFIREKAEVNKKLKKENIYNNIEIDFNI